MFRFEHIEMLYALILIPVFWLLFIFVQHWRRKKLESYVDKSLVRKLSPAQSKLLTWIKFVMLIVAFIMLIIGLANPQIGSKLVEGERSGIDLVIALDISNSMLAEDVKPNRLEQSKQAISTLINRLNNDRIGLVVFAGKAFKQLPITTDYGAARLFLNSVNTSFIPTQGTAIGQAIEMAISSFEENKNSKAIIVITDGENHEDDAVEMAMEAAAKGIKVYTIGVGSSQGVPIPEYNSYGQRAGYKKDLQGNVVITKLNEAMLDEIARAGEGVFVKANNSFTALDKVFDEINKMEKTKFETKLYSDYEDRFQYFIGLAIFFLIIELLLFERKSRWASRIKLFEIKSDENVRKNEY